MPLSKPLFMTASYMVSCQCGAMLTVQVPWQNDVEFIKAVEKQGWVLLPSNKWRCISCNEGKCNPLEQGKL